jgi:hypothetical protein
MRMETEEVSETLYPIRILGKFDKLRNLEYNIRLSGSRCRNSDVASRVRSQVRSSGICGGHRDTFRANYNYSKCSSTSAGTVVVGVPNGLSLTPPENELFRTE